MINNDKKYIEDGSEYRTVHLINGERKPVKVNSIVGYCNCSTHKGHVTSSLMKSHQCLEKKCPFLDAFLEYPYWQNRMAQEKSQQDRKIKIKNQQAKKKEKEEYIARDCQRKLYRARQIAAEKNYPIVIVRIARSIRTDSNYSYVLNYVSDNPCDDWKQYLNLVKELSAHMGGRYLLKRLRLPNGRLAIMADLEKIPAFKNMKNEY